MVVGVAMVWTPPPPPPHLPLHYFGFYLRQHRFHLSTPLFDYPTIAIDNISVQTIQERRRNDH